MCIEKVPNRLRIVFTIATVTNNGRIVLQCPGIVSSPPNKRMIGIGMLPVFRVYVVISKRLAYNVPHSVRGDSFLMFAPDVG